MSANLSDVWPTALSNDMQVILYLIREQDSISLPTNKHFQGLSREIYSIIIHFLFLPCLPRSRFCVDSHAIDVVTVLEAILTRRPQPREKLQCLYENLMSNNFRKTAVLKKYELWTKASQKRILLTNFGCRNCAKIFPDACFRFSIYLCTIFPGKF